MTLPEPIALEALNVEQIDPLLEEEIERYRQWYRWDFTLTARLVRQLVAARSLCGVALVAGTKAVGYSYIVVEDHKALIGDVYVADEYAAPENERLLMASTVEMVRRFGNVRRLEAQPMMLRYPYSHPRADRLERLFLDLDLKDTRWPEHYQGPTEFRIEPWTWRFEDEAAHLLYRAYRGHMDADINDQYRVPARARAYLSNMIRYPACGRFSAEASYVAIDKSDGRLAGAILSTIAEVGQDKVGHVAQLCIDPDLRRRGLARLLMLGSLTKFCELGCTHSTLTVTARNINALTLYQSLGYGERTRLAAYVWPSWPA